MRALLPSLLLAACLAPSARAALSAAAGKVDISPDMKGEKVWMAGFGATGRRPRGLHDPLYARLLVLSDGKTTLGFASFDLLGLYAKDVADIRAWSGFDQPGRYLIVTATHDHSGPDTLGLWGPWLGKSGVNMRYHERLKRAAAAELRRLVSDLKPARLSAAETRLDPRGLCRDSRDPRVIDPYLRVLRVAAAQGGAPISTLINWSCHPEVLGPDNRLLTADFPGPACMRVEEKTGGSCVYVSGVLGGLMTPDIKADNFYESYRLGMTVADAALALAAKAPATEARIRVSTQAVMVPIENTRYLLFLPGLAYGHDILDAQGRPLARWKRYWLPLKTLVTGGLRESERPWVRSEVGVVDLSASARILELPGELFPELLLGGYDGSYRAGWPLVTPGNPDPPDLTRAPKGPYLREEMNRPVKLVFGLANDELGYIVPPYDFKVRGNAAMLPRLPGHHYEETNSIGPRATGIIVDAAEKLLGGGR